MSAPAHSPLPWDVREDGQHPLTLHDATGVPVVIAYAGIVPEDEAEANVLLIKRAVAAHERLMGMARQLVQPFANIDVEFLKEVASANDGRLYLVGRRGLTAHFAQAILDARAAVALSEGR